MMKNEQNQEKKSLTGNNTQWVLVPLNKKAILKKTETYVLFDVDGQASAILSAKFLRKKEHDDYVFFSVPETYEVNCRVREQVGGRWQTTKEYKVTIKDLLSIIKNYDKVLRAVPKDNLPF